VGRIRAACHQNPVGLDLIWPPWLFPEPGVQWRVFALIVARAVAGPVGVAAKERQDWMGHLERAESAASRTASIFRRRLISESAKPASMM
jgi:hypothetical protein